MTGVSQHVEQVLIAVRTTAILWRARARTVKAAVRELVAMVVLPAERLLGGAMQIVEGCRTRPQICWDDCEAGQHMGCLTEKWRHRDR